MTMQQITIRLSKETIRQFDRAVLSQGQARNTVLAQLVQEYVQRAAQARKIGVMTLTALGIKPQRTRRKRVFNARKVARALKRTYGTSDGVEIANLNRNRWTAHP